MNNNHTTAPVRRILNTDRAPAAPNSPSNAGGIFIRVETRLSEMVQQWRERRKTPRTVTSLDHVDDLLLKDIGVLRAEVPVIVEYSVTAHNELSHGTTRA